jgi:hypothetical protein
MHQTTVCRSLQLMQHQFRLEPRHGSPVCRHGHNACLHHLRLAYREHRLMEGLLRIGTDVLHQSLLSSLAGMQLVPPRFRSGEHWAELVRHGLLDAAIVSSFCLEKLLLSGQAPSGMGSPRCPWVSWACSWWPPRQPRGGCCCRAREPRRCCARRWSGMALRWSSSQRPARNRRPGSSGPRPEAGDAGLPRPAGNGLDRSPWPGAPGRPAALIEQLWLLLPQGAVNTKAARQCLRVLRLQIAKAQTMQDPHGSQC